MLASFSSAAFTTASGVAVAPNADIEVRREDTGALAAIFANEDGTGPITQPGYQADAEGRFTFYAAGIRRGYKVKVTKGAETHTLNNVAIGVAAQLDVGAAGEAVMIAGTQQAAREGAGIKGDAGIGKVPIGDGSEFIQGALSGFAILNGYLAWSVAGNVLTVAVKTWAGADPSAADPVYISFRDATPATGLPLIRKLTAATSISINDTATLGTINATPFRLWCVAFDDGGTVRLALINCLGGTAPSLNIFPLAGWGIASSTLEDNASDSAHVFYSAGAAVAAKSYATLGYATWESGLATAGTWSAGPTRAQMLGLGVPLPGQVIQQQRVQSGAVQTGTTTIPADDTIPQNTEGWEVFSVSITPQSAANLLDLEASVHHSHSGAAPNMSVAFFQDATANAIAAVADGRLDTATAWGYTRLTHQKRAGGTTSQAYKTRIGSSVAGTVTVNGFSASRTYGGVMSSYMRVSEVMA